MSLFVNPVIRVALDALAERQRVIARNVANIHTPGYIAGVVDFEGALSQAVGDVEDGSADVESLDLSRVATYGISLNTPGLNGNNVSLETETLSGTETNLRYQLALRAVEGRINGMRDVIRSA
jgi:flagellar basal-body rod protein FlgB